MNIPIKGHVPDLGRIPKSLKKCLWMKSRADDNWHTGDIILASLPVFKDEESSDWIYEIVVLTIYIQDNGVAIPQIFDGEYCPIENIDFYVFLKYASGRD